MATSKRPRTTRSRKTADASDTEVPLATGVDEPSMAANSTELGADGLAHDNTLHNATDDSLDERIRQRAYELYLSRGTDGGSEVDDWLEAERQLRRGTARGGNEGLDAPAL